MLHKEIGVINSLILHCISISISSSMMFVKVSLLHLGGGEGLNVYQMEAKTEVPRNVRNSKVRK